MRGGAIQEVGRYERWGDMKELAGLGQIEVG